MSSTQYLLWLVAMAILIPVIVHGGTTWAYLRGNRTRSVRAPAPPARVPAVEDDGSVPAKQISRWADDGGAVRPPST